MPGAVIRVQDLRFRWSRTDAFVLSIPRLELAAGERLFLHGPSGSGKSTLLGLLAGILMPNTGQIQILGQELTQLHSALRDRFRADHIGFLFQQFNLVPYLSAIDNVLLPCRFSKRRRERASGSHTGLHAEAERLLHRLDMAPDLWNRQATALSVGQQQRVAAARALIGKPEIIIADEPTSSLDAARQTAFLELLKQECAGVGAALLFVSHDLRLAQAFDRTLELPALSGQWLDEAPA
jgi:putative ABC transport system ATP-binding protein